MQARSATPWRSAAAACMHLTRSAAFSRWVINSLCCASLASASICSSLAQQPAPASPSSVADTLYQQGQALIGSGHLAEAQRVLLQAHGQAPQSLKIMVTLGKVDALLGNAAEAVALLRDVETRDPGNTENQVNLAIVLAQQGAFEDALFPATSAVTRSPNSAAAHHIRARVLNALHREQEARQDFKAALALSPSDPLTLYDDAQLCEEAGDLDEEVQLLERLIPLRPTNAQDRFLLARALSRTGHQADAITQYREAIRLDPNNRPALYSLSRLLQAKDPAEAASLAARFRSLQVSEDELNAIRSQGNQGVLAMQSRDWARAATLFQSALATCAGCSLEATLEKDLGLSECQGGNTDAGILSLRRSLALNPKDLDTVRALEVAEKAGSPANATP